MNGSTPQYPKLDPEEFPILEPQAPPVANTHSTESSDPEFSHSREQAAAEPEPRNYSGWIGLVILFTFMISLALMGQAAKSSPATVKKGASKIVAKVAPPSQPADDKALKPFLLIREMTRRLGLPASEGDKNLKDSLKDIEPKAKKDLDLLVLTIQLNKELGLGLEVSALDRLSASKSERHRAIARLYAPGPLSKSEADTSLRELPKSWLSSKLAQIQTGERLGDTTIREKLLNPVPLVLVVIIAFFVFVGGAGLWVIYGIGRSMGKFQPLGLPNHPISYALADKFAMTCTRILIIFFVLQLIAGFLAEEIPGLGRFLTPLVYAGMIVTVLLLPRDHIFGEQTTARGLGLKFENTFSKLLWGVGGVSANVPLLILVLILWAPIMALFPSSSHPAGEALMNSPSLSTILSVLFLGAIAAPIWEEIVFRGMLFPALSKVMGGPIIGAVVSSFLFAAIHPQGPGGWPLLFTIAMMNCALTYQTRSLIPAIVLHMLNNAGAFLLILAIGA